ncbi:MAG: hypothetical protein EP343_04980 [Deltaproteobacteria bacterium]|nr:MAG: hypothetical protein EP343_04980 [Deltaproteobacteria bacterium]
MTAWITMRGLRPRFPLWGWGMLLCLSWVGLHCSQGPVNPEGGLVLCETSSDCPDGYICQMNGCLPRPGYYGASKPGDAGVEPLPDSPVGPELVQDTPTEQPPTEKPPVEQPPTEQTGCQNDGQCGAGQICLQGACQSGCRQTSDCSAGQICSNFKCQGCQNDPDCGAGQLCLNQTCTQGDCRQTADCLGGKLCKANQCVACSNDGECGSGKLCQSGACTPGTCRQNSDCPNGLLCKQSKCEACANDPDCGSGKLCINQVCVTGDCRFVSDCSAGQVCLQNQCSACTKNAECGSGNVCVQGACKTGNCLTTADCQNGQLCKSNTCAACANNTECGTGKVCDQGACKTGNCVTTADCSANQVCKNNTCGACTADADCPSTKPSCLQGVCQIGVAFDAQNKAQRWSDGTFAKDCAEYRFPPTGKTPAVKDGPFWIKPVSTQAEFAVHCNMTYAGGGWTLVIKADGNSSSFRYDSTFWTSKFPFNASGFAFDRQQALLASYHTVSVSDVLIQMQAKSGDPLRSLVVRKAAKSLYDIIQSGNETSFDVNAYKLAWTSMVVNPLVQGNCNKEGFNVKGTGTTGNLRRVRIGMIFNDQDSCITTDSFVGIGSEVLSSGNYAKWNGTSRFRDYRTFSYVYVRDLKSTVTPTKHNDAYRYPTGTYAKSCLEYRLPPAASTTSDQYWIQPTGQQPFKVFCLMLRQGGGWTLTLKADGGKTTFNYSSALWTNNSTHNPANTAFDVLEAKFASFYSVPFSEVKILLYPFPISQGNFQYMILPKKANSLVDIFKTQTYQPFDLSFGASAWRTVVRDGFMQTNCVLEGFNSFSNSNTCSSAGANDKCARVRIGIIGDDKSTCDDPDSRIGIGGDGNRCGQKGDLSVGNTYQCSNKSSEDRNITSMGYVWVR